ncbi:hypothetical protein PanWU01x14_063920 [Parasponia andersonii]|uniref:Uncharacterized protein n=1 Tax=Parasponia andersonii TaxID=3476 RepID=A0A2P5DH85_PARAD|nr:hypothetical protein PanWU01x14_063920 [Parasponia andersonii]
MVKDDTNDDGGGGGGEEEEDKDKDKDKEEEEEEEEEEDEDEEEEDVNDDDDKLEEENDNNNRNDEEVALLIKPYIRNINQEVPCDRNIFHDDYFDRAYINIFPNVIPESHSTQGNHDSLIQYAKSFALPLMYNSEA